MYKLRDFLSVQSLKLPEKYVPGIFLLVLILAFGFFIPQLGIYQDDWVFVYNAYARGPEGLREFLNADGTPFSSLVNIALFQVLGVKPLYWHVSALFVRWLTVVAFWLLLRKLWHKNALEIFFTCMIFAIHPFFNLQPLSFTFLHIWLSYCFLAFSIYWMVLSIDQPEKFWLYLILSFAAGILAILTSEYFAGLELLRPVILWYILHKQKQNIGTKLSRILRIWFPYIFIPGVYAIWRFFIYEVPTEGRNDPVIIKALLQNPFSGIQTIIANLVPDTAAIVVSAWYKILEPTQLNLTDRRNLIFVFLGILTSLGVFFVAKRINFEVEDDDAKPGAAWRYEAFWLGLMIVLLGLIPPYAGGLFINEKNPLWNSRFGLASMLGASLLITVFLKVFSTDKKTRLAIFAILIGLSTSYHARYTNDFRYAWKKQMNLFRQLIYRVPELRTDTAIIAEGEILYYMGDYPTAYAINTIYAQPFNEDGATLKYWFFGITSNFGRVVDEFMEGMDIEATHRSVSFIGRSDNSLIISFEPESGECLHVIRPQDITLRTLSPLLKRAGHLSALDRINTLAVPSSPFLQIIGEEFSEDWCTFYQKADLARQNKDWQQVVDLWAESRAKKYMPGSYFEYFPIIDAFVELNRWDDAIQVTREVRQVFPIARLPLCDYWSALPVSIEKEAAFQKIEAKLDCFEKLP